MDCLVCQLSTWCFDVQGTAFSNIRLKALCACISSVTYAFESRQTFVLTSINKPVVFTCLCQDVHSLLWMVSYGLSCLPAFYLVLWCSRYCFQQYTVESFVRMYQLSDLCFRVTPDIVLTSINTPAVFTCLCQDVHSLLIDGQLWIVLFASFLLCALMFKVLLSAIYGWKLCAHVSAQWPMLSRHARLLYLHP